MMYDEGPRHSTPVKSEELCEPTSSERPHVRDSNSDQSTTGRSTSRSVRMSPSSISRKSKHKAEFKLATEKTMVIQVHNPCQEEKTMVEQRKEIERLIQELRARDRELNETVTSHQQQLSVWEQDRQMILRLQNKCQLLEADVKQQREKVSQIETDRSESVASSHKQQPPAEPTTQLEQLQNCNENLTDSLKRACTDKGTLEAREEELLTLLKIKENSLKDTHEELEKVRTKLKLQEIEAEENKSTSQQLATYWQQQTTKLKDQNKKLQDECEERDEKVQKTTAQLQEALHQALILQQALCVSCEQEKYKDELLMSLKSRQERCDVELTHLRNLFRRKNREMTLLQLTMDTSRESGFEVIGAGDGSSNSNTDLHNSNTEEVPTASQHMPEMAMGPDFPALIPPPYYVHSPSHRSPSARNHHSMYGDDNAEGALSTSGHTPPCRDYSPCQYDPGEQFQQAGGGQFQQAGSSQFQQAGGGQFQQAGDSQFQQSGSRQFQQAGSSQFQQAGSSQFQQAGGRQLEGLSDWYGEPGISFNQNNDRSGQPKKSIKQSGFRSDHSPGSFQQTGFPPDQSRGSFQQTGFPPDQSRGSFQQMGFTSDQTRGSLQQTGFRPDQSGGNFNQTGFRPDQSRDSFQQTGFRSNQSGGKVHQTGFRPDQSGGNFNQSGFRPDQSGGSFQQSGFRPDQSGGSFNQNRSSQSGDRHRQASGSRPGPPPARYSNASGNLSCIYESSEREATTAGGDQMQEVSCEPTIGASFDGGGGAACCSDHPKMMKKTGSCDHLHAAQQLDNKPRSYPESKTPQQQQQHTCHKFEVKNRKMDSVCVADSPNKSLEQNRTGSQPRSNTTAEESSKARCACHASRKKSASSERGRSDPKQHTCDKRDEEPKHRTPSTEDATCICYKARCKSVSAERGKTKERCTSEGEDGRKPCLACLTSNDRSRSRSVEFSETNTRSSKDENTKDANSVCCGKGKSLLSRKSEVSPQRPCCSEVKRNSDCSCSGEKRNCSGSGEKVRKKTTSEDSHKSGCARCSGRDKTECGTSELHGKLDHSEKTKQLECTCSTKSARSRSPRSRHSHICGKHLDESPSRQDLNLQQPSTKLLDLPTPSRDLNFEQPSTKMLDLPATSRDLNFEQPSTKLLDSPTPSKDSNSYQPVKEVLSSSTSPFVTPPCPSSRDRNTQHSQAQQPSVSSTASSYSTADSLDQGNTKFDSTNNPRSLPSKSRSLDQGKFDSTNNPQSLPSHIGHSASLQNHKVASAQYQYPAGSSRNQNAHTSQYSDTDSSQNRDLAAVSNPVSYLQDRNAASPQVWVSEEHLPSRDQSPENFSREISSKYSTDVPPYPTDVQRYQNDIPKYSKDTERYCNDDMPRYSNDDMPRYSNDDMPRYSNDDMQRFSNDDMQRFSNDDMQRYSNDDMPRFSNEDMPRYSNDDMPRYSNDDQLSTGSSGESQSRQQVSSPPSNKLKTYPRADLPEKPHAVSPVYFSLPVSPPNRLVQFPSDRDEHQSGDVRDYDRAYLDRPEQVRDYDRAYLDRPEQDRASRPEQDRASTPAGRNKLVRSESSGFHDLSLREQDVDTEAFWQKLMSVRHGHPAERKPAHFPSDSSSSAFSSIHRDYLQPVAQKPSQDFSQYGSKPAPAAKFVTFNPCAGYAAGGNPRDRQANWKDDEWKNAEKGGWDENREKFRGGRNFEIGGLAYGSHSAKPSSMRAEIPFSLRQAPRAVMGDHGINPSLFNHAANHQPGVGHSWNGRGVGSQQVLNQNWSTSVRGRPPDMNWNDNKDNQPAFLQNWNTDNQNCNADSQRWKPEAESQPSLSQNQYVAQHTSSHDNPQKLNKNASQKLNRQGNAHKNNRQPQAKKQTGRNSKTVHWSESADESWQQLNINLPESSDGSVAHPSSGFAGGSQAQDDDPSWLQPPEMPTLDLDQSLVDERQDEDEEPMRDRQVQKFQSKRQQQFQAIQDGYSQPNQHMGDGQHFMMGGGENYSVPVAGGSGGFEERLSSFLEMPDLRNETLDASVAQGPSSPASKLHRLLLESQDMIKSLEGSVFTKK